MSFLPLFTAVGLGGIDRCQASSRRFKPTHQRSKEDYDTVYHQIHLLHRDQRRSNRILPSRREERGRGWYSFDGTRQNVSFIVSSREQIRLGKNGKTYLQYVLLCDCHSIYHVVQQYDLLLDASCENEVRSKKKTMITVIYTISEFEPSLPLRRCANTAS